MVYDLIVVGGGAAGFFGAIQCAERAPGMRILILEKSPKLLSKVRISGGGRCNVTHACFDPRIMVQHYPRGHKALLGPFHRFLCGDMMHWLESHGVPTHTEEDGRVFPQSNDSRSIVDCFMRLCQEYGIGIRTGCGVHALERAGRVWHVRTREADWQAGNVLISAGSSGGVWTMLESMGFAIVPPVPSLFTFDIRHPLLRDLQGLSLPNAELAICATRFAESGPLLITHRGLSGPAVLKLSAWAARALHAMDYRFEVRVNWCAMAGDTVMEHITDIRQRRGRQALATHALFGLPKRLWLRMLDLLKLRDLKIADLNAAQLEALCAMLCRCVLPVHAKSTFKEEFVTCGGVDLKEIDFRTMESKQQPGLFLAGEVLDIDAVTGGFNFQAAWTGAFVAAEAIAARRSQD